MNGLINNEEMRDSKFQQAADEAADELAEFWPEGEGFSSSAMTSVIESFLHSVGLKTEYKSYKLMRKDLPEGRYPKGY